MKDLLNTKNVEVTFICTWQYMSHRPTEKKSSNHFDLKGSEWLHKN